MKINGNNPHNVGNIYKNQQTKAPEQIKKDNEVKEQDRIELSDQARQIANLVEQITKLPEIRSDRVNQIKEQIVKDSYHIPVADVAKRMLDPENQ